MYESIGCSNSGGKSGPGEKRQRVGEEGSRQRDGGIGGYGQFSIQTYHNRETRGVQLKDGLPATVFMDGGRWEDDGTSVARAESDGKGKEKDGRKAGQPPPPRLARCDAKVVNEKGGCVEKGIQEEGWAVGGESFYQALGYVSGGITQSRSESGEPKGQERGRAGAKKDQRREREEEGVGAGWMDGCGFTQSEQRWPGSVTIHPLECTLFPPTDSPDFLPDAN
ncbi:uncharacterized protein BO88DRAFT_427403 [Aspergillus vadensis CBS 113365]|uniref:Uncharacterized protein n=1 Tax=Aspergillus vadensis (strain CBS 113365 / IMI 142717 / IBT 24658) TaxID=1448311 RepID=A0A319B288_ASPVC|nr:hypothetical protein BO88DRAFT_427403 [Aspergillus vadensis CBS 113365]PYH66796.1 hypothetical protein BO88DRAFT_427403 [Aspergillus vadensis CBS 113365]